MVSTRKSVCCYSGHLGYVSKQQKNLYFEEWGNIHLVRAKDSELEHRWQIRGIKSFNTERKFIKSCIMPFTFYHSLPILLHFCQDKQSQTLFQGKTAKVVPCAASVTVLKDATPLHACSTSSIPVNREMLQYEF